MIKLMSRIQRAIQMTSQWLRRKRTQGTVVTEDDLWNYILKKNPEKTNLEHEAIFEKVKL